MLQDKLIDPAQRQEARPLFAAGPLLSELLSDPIMHMLMAADRVEYRDIEAVLERARSQLGTGAHRVISAPAYRHSHAKTDGPRLPTDLPQSGQPGAALRKWNRARSRFGAQRECCTRIARGGVTGQSTAIHVAGLAARLGIRKDQLDPYKS